MPPDLVYSPSESGGKLRPVADVVYKQSVEFQSDTGNHNPRVGGSSPSSATINQTLSDDGGEQFTDACKLSAESIRPPLDLRAQIMARRAARNTPANYTLTDEEWVRQQLTRHRAIMPDWRTEKKAQSVYFIHSASGGIKIGTAIDVSKRLKGLQTAHPVKLELLAQTTGGRAVEQAYHARFAEHRLHGEWFAPHPDILAEIERLSAKADAQGYSL